MGTWWVRGHHSQRGLHHALLRTMCLATLSGFINTAILVSGYIFFLHYTKRTLELTSNKRHLGYCNRTHAHCPREKMVEEGEERQRGRMKGQIKIQVLPPYSACEAWHQWGENRILQFLMVKRGWWIQSGASVDVLSLGMGQSYPLCPRLNPREKSIPRQPR